MVEPTDFFLNEETFADNKFMHETTLARAESTKIAIDEFKRFREKILDAGVEVETYK